MPGILSRLVATAALALGATLWPAAAPAALDATEQAMAEWIDARSEDAIDLLEGLVNIGSGTMNVEGVRRVGKVLRAELLTLGLDTEWVDMPEELRRAGHLIGRSGGSRGKRVLLIGHLDTVFEASDEFQAYWRDGNIATGPGISDMKSGNVVIVYALKALQHVGALKAMQVTVFYTGDEEKPGRPLEISRKHLIEAGQWADVALGFEGAVRHNGEDWATIARRSSTSWRLEVSGRQAHSSVIFSEEVGSGAIFEAARILAAFHDEVRGEEYLTFNAGAIVGGTDVSYDYATNTGTAFGKTNVVAQKAVVHGGLRTISLEQRERAKAAMTDVVARHLPHTDASITFSDGYPPMPPTLGNVALQKQLSAINEDLGRGAMPILNPAMRGAADVSFVAPYTDALAGLGANGKGAHSPNESLELDSLAVAVKRAAILLYRLSTASD
ncbi:MAG: M20/M25/M40 family metallo-hydrolase [Pseudomonadota bacterium]